MVMIVGNRRYVEIPGSSSYELPPLMLKSRPQVSEVTALVENASTIVDSESLIPGPTQDALHAEDRLENVRFGLAVSLVHNYRSFIRHWTWGESSSSGSGNARSALRPNRISGPCCGPTFGPTRADPAS